MKYLVLNIKSQGIEKKLETAPKESYDLEIGELNTIDLGHFQGNVERMFPPRFEIVSTSNKSLNDQFIVESHYQAYKMKLVIDLGFANSSFINSSVNGSLFIRAPDFEELSYPIGFSLVCNNETRCP